MKKKPAFIVTGFIQPVFVYEILTLTPDADGLNDRQLFHFPPERELLLDNLVVPMPSDTPDLSEFLYHCRQSSTTNTVHSIGDNTQPTKTSVTSL